MSAAHPDPGSSTGVGAHTGADGVQALDPQQLGAYFVLTEAVSLLQHQIEQQLRTEGDLSYVQFQLLARLADADGPLTMTRPRQRRRLQPQRPDLPGRPAGKGWPHHPRPLP